MILDLALTHLPRQQHKEIPRVVLQSSKEDEKGAPEVELKPLPSHLRYEFLTLIIHSVLLLILNWITTDFKNC